MTIEYTITPDDVFAAYWYNWQHSARARRRILLLAVFITVLSIGITYFTKGGTLNWVDVATALAFGVLFVLVIPYYLKFRTKPDTRTLSVSNEGIETEIGGQSGNVPWSAVESIITSDKYIIVTGKNSNIFVIPKRAFATDDDRQYFEDKTQQFFQAAAAHS